MSISQPSYKCARTLIHEAASSSERRERVLGEYFRHGFMYPGLGLRRGVELGAQRDMRGMEKLSSRAELQCYSYR